MYITQGVTFVTWKRGSQSLPIKIYNDKTKVIQSKANYH